MDTVVGARSNRGGGRRAEWGGVGGFRVGDEGAVLGGRSWRWEVFVCLLGEGGRDEGWMGDGMGYLVIFGGVEERRGEYNNINLI